MDEAYPQLDSVLPLPTIQAKLSTFSSRCNDLLQESVCLVSEIAKFADLVCLFAPLNLALEEFLREQPRLDAFFNERHVACSQEQEEVAERRSGSLAQFGITKEEDTVSDFYVACQEKLETVAIALPKLRVRLRNLNAVRQVKSETKSRARCCRPDKALKCEVCAACARTVRTLERHMAREHADMPDFDCAACGFKAKIEDVYQRHVRSFCKANTEKPFKCGICNERLKQKRSMDRHMARHARDDKNFVCARCGFKTKVRGILERHAALWCDTRTVFQCAVCGSVKGSRISLQDHLRMVHSGHPYMCEVCSQRSKTISKHNEHMKIHSGEKNWVCEMCGFRTWFKANLRVHMLTHGGKTLRCPHEGCTVVVKRKGALRVHIKRFHADRARPYACDHCEWTFATPHELKRHVQSHAGERPYPCQICGYPFSRPSNRRVHMRTVHKLDPSDPRLQPSLPAAYSSVADGDAPANSADVGLAVQSDFPADKIRHRRRREPLFSNKKHSTSRVSVTASSRQDGLPYHVRSADRRAAILSTNQITETSANQVASIFSANQVVTTPASHLAFNPILTVPETHESTISTATGPCGDVASFYNPQLLDYQFQSFSGQF